MAEHPAIHQLVARSTLRQIGAHKPKIHGSDICEWQIGPPVWVEENGACYLIIGRSHRGYQVSILQDGDGRPVHIRTLVKRNGVADLDVDDVVQEICGANGREAQGGK